MCQNLGIAFRTCNDLHVWTKSCDNEEPCKFSGVVHWRFVHGCYTPKCCECVTEQLQQHIVRSREAAMNAWLVDCDDQLYEAELQQTEAMWELRNSVIKEHEGCGPLAVAAYAETGSTPGFADGSV